MENLQGRTVAHYRVESLVGCGGMATVYLAMDMKHSRRVALKVMRPDLAVTLGHDRFLREIRTTAELSHPLIVPLLDSGATDDLLFYAMPYLPEGSLRDHIGRAGRLSFEETLRITKGVAEALDYAHSRGFVHRDVKPGNILLAHGYGCVADFGIATAISGAATSSTTQTGVAIGTPVYMSPEQIRGEPLDGRSDLYSLACVTYEMIAGQPLFAGSSPEHRVHFRPSDLRNLLQKCPAATPQITTALKRALVSDPRRRLRSGAEFAEALEAASGKRLRRPFSKRLVLAVAALSGVLALGTWGTINLIDNGAPSGPFRMISIEPTSGATLSEAALQSAVPIRLLVDSGVRRLKAGSTSYIELISTIRVPPGPTGSHGESLRVVASRSESRIPSQQALEGLLSRWDISLDHRIHLSVVRTTYDDRTRKQLGRQALGSFEYGVRPVAITRGTFRLLSTDPSSGSRLRRVALRVGVPVKALVESRVWMLRDDSFATIELIVTRDVDMDALAPPSTEVVIASRRDSRVLNQMSLEGIVRLDHVADDSRVHLIIQRRTYDEATQRLVASQVLASFEYGVSAN